MFSVAVRQAAERRIASTGWGSAHWREACADRATSVSFGRRMLLAFASALAGTSGAQAGAPRIPGFVTAASTVDDFLAVGKALTNDPYWNLVLRCIFELFRPSAPPIVKFFTISEGGKQLICAAQGLFHLFQKIFVTCPCLLERTLT